MRPAAIIALLLLLLLPTHAKAASDPLASALGARAAILIDGRTGRVLYSRNADQALPVASVTKMLTALIALERGNLDDIVTVSENAWGTEGATIYLNLGEQQPLRDLLYATILESANDAATAIAEHIAGSVGAFTALMNERARQLGAVQTHFVNANGLHHPDHFSTAADLALIARGAMQNPAFRDLVRTEEYIMSWPEKQSVREMWNHNQFLYLYEGTTGIKNGWTEHAGFTLAASVKRGEVELIGVLLDTKGRPWWGDAQALFDYGFEQILPREQLRASVPRQSEPVIYGVATTAGARSAPLPGRAKWPFYLLAGAGATTLLFTLARRAL